MSLFPPFHKNCYILVFWNTTFLKSLGQRYIACVKQVDWNMLKVMLDSLIFGVQLLFWYHAHSHYCHIISPFWRIEKPILFQLAKQKINKRFLHVNNLTEFQRLLETAPNKLPEMMHHWKRHYSLVNRKCEPKACFVIVPFLIQSYYPLPP